MYKFDIIMNNGDMILNLPAESGNDAMNKVLQRPYYFCYEDIQRVEPVPVTI